MVRPFVRKQTPSVKFNSPELQKLWDDSSAFLVDMCNGDAIICKDDVYNCVGQIVGSDEIEEQQWVYSFRCLNVSVRKDYLYAKGEQKAYKQLVSIVS